MTFPKARLAVSAALFLSWLAFLFYLVVTARSIVLSQPQFLIAQSYVVVEVRDQGGRPDPDVTVAEVLWAAERADHQLTKLHLPDLAACTKANGYRGEGKYLLPLVKSATVPFAIAPLPRLEEIRIYPWTPDTRVQVEKIIAAKT